MTERNQAMAVPSRRSGEPEEEPRSSRVLRAALLSVLLLLPGAAEARDVVFGLRPVDPMVSRAGDGVAGLEAEIVSAALAVRGHRLVPYLGPLPRLDAALRERRIDGLAPAVGHFGSKAWLTRPYLEYRNVAVTLSDRDLDLGSPADLKALRVTAFPGAVEVLGADYREAVAASPAYREEFKQELQVLSLKHGRADVIVVDRTILHHHVGRLSARLKSPLSVREHELFQPVRYRAAFADPVLAEDFNEGLVEISRNGQLDRIRDRYREP